LKKQLPLMPNLHNHLVRLGIRGKNAVINDIVEYHSALAEAKGITPRNYPGK
jgi:hypothetical protein